MEFLMIGGLGLILLVVIIVIVASTSGTIAGLMKEDEEE